MLGVRCGRLSRAVLLRSETQVIKIVDKSPDSLREKTSLGHTPMHLAANWPAGVSILLNAGANNLMNEPDNVGLLPVAYASYSDCVASVQLLVGADCAFYHEDLLPDCYSDVFRHPITWSSEEIAKFMLQALADRRRRLAGIASQELPYTVKKRIDILPAKVIDAGAALVYKLLKQNHVRLPPSLVVPSTWQTIYHLLHSSVFEENPESLTYWADLFYNAGFHDFTGYDESRRNLLMENRYMSVFWHFRDLPRYMDLYLWYLRKGIRLGHKIFRKTDEGDWIPHTPGAFYVGSFIVTILSGPWIDLSSIMKMQLRSLLTKVVDERTSDSCKCACSIQGCHALTSMLKERRRIQRVLIRLADEEYEHDQFLYQFPIFLASLLNITNDGWSFFPAEILRFLTFERLEMTHTCCFYHKEKGCNGYFDVFDDNDRVEIQEEESADLIQLEALMSEFRHVYTKLGAPLPEFLQGYWTTRMDKVMSGKEAINEEEASRIRELGVTWEPREQRCATPDFITRPSYDARYVTVDENVISRPPVERQKRRHSF
ncbi:hypothetical protein MMC29_007596 [Sticta canariensis]|nr:hypothetical protein [Sticta canariensis]